MTRKPPDPLANLFSRKRISLAQFKAGQEFRRCYRLADSQPAAEKMLTRCYLRLGDDGSALVRDMLIRALTVKQVAASRGMASGFVAKRLAECLSSLSVVFGFVGDAAEGRVLNPDNITK
jgi:hypothetical protein